MMRDVSSLRVNIPRQKFILLLLAISTMGFSQSEHCFDREDLTFNQKWEMAKSFFNRAGEGVFTGRNGISIRYKTLESSNNNRSVVILPGYRETLIKHLETAFDFHCLGYNVYLMIHAGMGESGRVRNLENPQVVYVDTFDQYIQDARTFIRIVRGLTHHPLYLYAHSTGGLIASHALANDSMGIRAVAMTSPLFALNLGCFPKFLAKGILFSNLLFNNDRGYVIGYGDYEPTKELFSKNDVTHSYLRFNKYLQDLHADRSLWTGGPSNRWLSEVLKITTTSAVKAVARKVETPILVFQAGEDKVVLPENQKLFCDETKDCRLVNLPLAYHEIYRELDRDRTSFFLQAHQFFLSH